jgi:phage tail sheath gpL-like
MSIVLTGLTNGYPLPGELAEILFAQGPSSGGTSVYGGILIGNKLSTGSALVEKIYGPSDAVSFSSEADAISLFGAGSELHRMARRFFAVNTSTPLSAIAVAEGASATAATGTITVANAATGPSTLTIYVSDDSIDIGIATGDSAIAIATAAVAAINSKTFWGVTAANSGTAVITLTAKQLGLRGNDINYQAQLRPSAITTTVTATSSTLMTGGTVSDDNTNALAVLAPYRFYYIMSAAGDATNLGRLKSQVGTQALPITGIRQRYMAGSSASSVSAANSIATGINDPRFALCWQMSSDVVPAELAANLGAVVSLVESDFSSVTLNFDSFGSNANTSALWKIKAPRSAIAPTKLQQVSALNNGVTPIASSASGASYLVKLINSYSLNGSVPDYRVRDWHKVSVCDRYTDDLLGQAAALLRGKTVADDPKQNESPPPGAITPAALKTIINRLTRDYFESGLLRDVANIIANTKVQYDSINAPNQLRALVPLEPINILDIVAFSIQQL